jgi:hypothetical protein
MKYVSIRSLTINGKAFEHYTEFSEGEVEKRAPVNLMTRTGVVSKTPRRTLMLTTVVPAGVEEEDWEGMEDAVIVAEDESGRRITWTGCYVAKAGEAKASPDKEVTRQVDFIVTGDKITE